MMTLFFKGILCNVLVCAAVWLALRGSVGYRQDRGGHIAGLCLHSGRFRTLRGQHVFSAHGLAAGPDRPRSSQFLTSHPLRSPNPSQSRSGDAWQYRGRCRLCRRCVLGDLSGGVWRVGSSREVKRRQIRSFYHEPARGIWCSGNQIFSICQIRQIPLAVARIISMRCCNFCFRSGMLTLSVIR